MQALFEKAISELDVTIMVFANMLRQGRIEYPCVAWNMPDDIVWSLALKISLCGMISLLLWVRKEASTVRAATKALLASADSGEGDLFVPTEAQSILTQSSYDDALVGLIVGVFWRRRRNLI